jgi:hypothetical protein
MVNITSEREEKKMLGCITILETKNLIFLKKPSGAVDIRIVDEYFQSWQLPWNRF